jgi:hypothetical protein
MATFRTQKALFVHPANGHAVVFVKLGVKWACVCGEDSKTTTLKMTAFKDLFNRYQDYVLHVIRQCSTGMEVIGLASDLPEQVCGGH